MTQTERIHHAPIASYGCACAFLRMHIRYAYDAIGNPTNYLANNIDVSLYWTGRQMTCMLHPYGGAYYYEYNDEGLRTKKTGEGITTEYFYDGTRLISVKQTWYTIIYLYDDGMTPIGMLYRSSTGTEWVTYWFERNLQGDIVATYSADGTKLLSYTYDAFGNKTTKYLATDTGHGASTNPIGYRGYYYDGDLGLYFTQTRLYDPTTGRFISSDRFDVIAATPDALTDKNLYIYCDNDPVNRVDRGGAFWHIIIGAAIGGVMNVVCSAVAARLTGENYTLTDVLIDGVSGALTGALAATGAPMSLQRVGQAAIAGAASVVEQGIKKGFDEIDYKEAAFNATWAAVTASRTVHSKGDQKHLMTMGIKATKNIKSKGLTKTAKFYFSQTYTMFYGPVLNGLKKDAVSNIVLDIIF